MEYGIVLLALLSLAIKGYSGKRISGHVTHVGLSFLFNLVRMLLCTLIVALIIFAEGNQDFLAVDYRMVWICVLSGVANASFLVGWILAIQRNSMALVDVGLTLGSMIPAILCAFLFQEEISGFKMIGFVMIVVATVVLSGNHKSSAKSGFLGTFLLLFAAIGDGMAGFAQQLYKQYYTEVGGMTHGVYYPKTVFHFYTYFFASLILFVVFVVCFIMVQKAKSKEERSGMWKISRSSMIHIFVMSVCFFLANYLQTVATNDYGMSSQMLYPIIKGGCLITVNFTAMMFFDEKITIRSIIGSLVALCGIVSMSVL